VGDCHLKARAQRKLGFVSSAARRQLLTRTEAVIKRWRGHEVKDGCRTSILKLWWQWVARGESGRRVSPCVLCVAVFGALSAPHLSTCAALCSPGASWRLPPAPRERAIAAAASALLCICQETVGRGMGGVCSCSFRRLYLRPFFNCMSCKMYPRDKICLKLELNPIASLASLAFWH